MKKMRTQRILSFLHYLVLAGVIGATPNLADATTYTWTGSSGDWTNAANWDLGSSPNSTTADAVISNGSSVTIQNPSGSSSLYSNSVMLNGGSSLALYGTSADYYLFSVASITADQDSGPFYLSGGWLTGTGLTINSDVVLSGRDSLIKTGHSNTITINGDISGTGRLNTLSNYGTLLFNDSITPGTDGTVGTLEISYKYDGGHSNPSKKEFSEDIMLNFDLGDTSNYDQIIIIGNGTSLTIHDLDWSNIMINELDGFDVGVYTLIDDIDLDTSIGLADSIIGSLGTDLVREVGGYTETLSLVDNDLILTVSVPEPTTFGLLFLGIMAVIRRRK